MDNSKVNSPMTRWHWILLIITPIAVQVSMFLPHSFNSFIAEYRAEKDPESLALLDMKTVLVSFLCHVLMFIVLPMYERFPVYHQIYSFIGYLLISTSCFASSQIGRQEEDYLFLTYSVIYGIGGGIVLSVFHKNIADYFPRDHDYHLIATCIHFLGFPLATLFGNPINAYLIEKLGLRKTYMVLGAFTLSCGIIVSTLVKPKINKYWIPCCQKNADGEAESLVSSEKRKEEQVKEVSVSENSEQLSEIKTQWSDIFRTAQIYPWCLGKCLNYASWFALKTNLTTYFHFYLNLSFQESANLMITYAVFQVIIGLMAVIFGNYCHNYLIHIHIFSGLTLSLLLFLWVHVVGNTASGYIMSFLVGGLIQVNLNFGYNGAGEVSGCSISRAWSVTLVACGTGILFSPLFGGIILDLTNEPSYFFAVNAFSYLVASGLHGLTWLLMRQQRKTK